MKAFDTAPLLMDAKKQKTGSDGGDGADKMNGCELERMAKRTGEPIASFRVHHDKPDKETDLVVEDMDSEEFRGLAGALMLCVGARVLLTHNLWVAAGLMNGALGWVKGFLWPEGGDPGSKESKKRAPVIVFVEFDDVNLGGEFVADEAGKAKWRARSFFPEDPSRKNWVLIWQEKCEAVTEEHVIRYQFPLVWAWALTHWKAQGMTLRRVRIALGKRVAQSPGIGYVCVTRVRHPTDIVFEIDFPEYETFQNAKHKEAFRERCRFELRLRARASRTILKYAAGDGVPRVVCEADEWTEGDARIAVALLRRLTAKGDMKRAALKQSGRPVDKNAWLWGEKDPDFERELQEAVDALVTCD